MFKKILVAIYDSTMSRNVFEAGLSLAKTTGASLMLLHVLSPEEKYNPGPFIYSELKDNPNVEPILEAYREQWQKDERWITCFYLYCRPPYLSLASTVATNLFFEPGDNQER